MHVLQTVKQIETATDCRWWLLAGFLLATTRWPALTAIAASAVALATWYRGGES
jgi:hypothetical protein